MKLMEYLKDKILLLTLHMGCMLLLAGFLYATGYEPQYCLLIIIFWILILALWIGYGFYSRRCYFSQLWDTLEKMDQRYLLGELMPVSHRLEDRMYREMIRISNKAVIERTRQIEDSQKEYREYIESWVHEVKAPITSIDLMCGNCRGSVDNKAPITSIDLMCGNYRGSVDNKAPITSIDLMCGNYRGNVENPGRGSRSLAGQDEKGNGREDVVRRIRLENQKIENYVDMALYYARSEDVYKDYVIRKTMLGEIAVVVLKRNKHYMIQNQVQAEVDCKNYAYTDQKWITFILNQLVLNCTKYRRKTGARIWIYTEEYTQKEEIGEYPQKKERVDLSRHSHGVRLVVKDNGIGIRKEELCRIFEKGFTGSNGRKTERSTGMGLYLCKKLCGKLGIEIYAESKEGEGTEIVLDFPVSSYLSELKSGTGELPW